MLNYLHDFKELEKMKYVVCFSGGHSSALTAIETVKKAGKENVILLNHNISAEVEHKDIKRFKQDIADYLDLSITYANMDGWEIKTPLRICRELGALVNPNGMQALCTYNLKTKPFHEWLAENYPADIEHVREDLKIIYGFDMQEKHRIQRRAGIMATMGYKTDYPLALWKRTIDRTEDIGIKRPITYRIYKHANCEGCLKAGKQQWYITYCLRPDIFQEAKETESELGYSILKKNYLEELESEFKEMKYEKNICPSQKTDPNTFWANVERIMPEQQSLFPCECAI